MAQMLDVSKFSPLARPMSEVCSSQRRRATQDGQREWCALDALGEPEENTGWKVAPEGNVAQNNANIITIHFFTKAMQSVRHGSCHGR